MRMQDRVEIIRCYKRRLGCLAWDRQVEGSLADHRCHQEGLEEHHRQVRYGKVLHGSQRSWLTPYSRRHAATPTRFRASPTQRHAYASLPTARPRHTRSAQRHASIHATRDATEYAARYASGYAPSIPGVPTYAGAESCAWSRTAADEPAAGDAWTAREIGTSVMGLLIWQGGLRKLRKSGMETFVCVGP